MDQEPIDQAVIEPVAKPDQTNVGLAYGSGFIDRLLKILKIVIKLAVLAAVIYFSKKYVIGLYHSLLNKAIPPG